MKTKITILVLTLFLSLASFAQPGRQNFPKQNQGEPMIVNVIPDLTQQQKDQIKQFHNQMLKATTPLRAEIEQKKAELNVLMTKDTDTDQKQKVVKQIEDLRTQMQMERIKFHDNVRALLNENQQIAFDNWYLNHSRKGHGPKGKGMGYGPRGRNTNCFGQTPPPPPPVPQKNN